MCAYTCGSGSGQWTEQACISTIFGGGDLTCPPAGTQHFMESQTRSLGANCWEAYLPNYPNCGGYSSAGYTCVGDYCAAMDPGGSPSTCAVDKGANYVVDQATGRCSPSPGPTGSAGAVCSGHGTCDAGTPTSTGNCACSKGWYGNDW